jgi:hypothetical protein
MNGTEGVASIEAAGKDDGIKQLAHWIADCRRLHALGRARASFGWCHHP